MFHIEFYETEDGKQPVSDFLDSLDSKMAVINCVELARGTVNMVDFSIRRVVEIAIRSKASYVVLAHNHRD